MEAPLEEESLTAQEMVGGEKPKPYRPPAAKFYLTHVRSQSVGANVPVEYICQGERSSTWLRVSISGAGRVIRDQEELSRLEADEGFLRVTRLEFEHTREVHRDVKGQYWLTGVYPAPERKRITVL